jgi:hypothetical protein
MKFFIIPLLAAICSPTTTTMFIKSFGNGFLNSGLIKTSGFVNGFDNGLVKTKGFIGGFNNGLVKTNGFANGFDNGLIRTNGVASSVVNNGVSVARINSVQTNFPNQVVATVENIAALPVAPLPVAHLPVAFSFATFNNFARFD